MCTCNHATLFIVLCTLSTVYCHPSFQQNIPNGFRIPHPCRPNHFWKGVGHNNPKGGGALNPFGVDLKAAGFTWTPELCKKDSDGDGRTNGEELGDPKCVWKKGDVPESNTGLSHPGVCNPFDSAECKKKNEKLVENKVCEDDKFKCDGIDKTKDVFNMTFRFAKTKVPAIVTNYFCQIFEIPLENENSTYHLLGSKPFIDNAEVMHHALIYGCNSAPTNKELLNKPYKCTMAGTLVPGAPACFSLLGFWSVGSAGQCFHENAGVLVGKGGFKYVMVQYHWNNVKARGGMTDSSAMMFYATKNLRQYNAKALYLSQSYLTIPPGRESYKETATCTSKCTSAGLKKPIFVTSALFHMHYMGQNGGVEHIRDGKVLAKPLIEYGPFNYDSQVDIQNPIPIEVRPGDEMKITCDYKSTDIPQITYWGESTQDEMCVAFFMYYPANAGELDKCNFYGEIDQCEIETDFIKNPQRGMMVQDCNLTDFIGPYWYTTVKPKIEEYCDRTGGVCKHQCKEFMKNELLQHPCMKGWPKKFVEMFSVANVPVQSKELLDMRLRTSPCDIELALESRRPGTAGPENGGTVFLLYIVMQCVAGILLVLLVVIIVWQVYERKSKQSVSPNQKSNSCSNSPGEKSHILAPPQT